MRVSHIAVYPIMGEQRIQKAASVTIDGIVIWPPLGWYVELRLVQVTGPDYGRIEDAISTTRKLRFPPPDKKGYNYREESAFVEFHDLDFVRGYVIRGVLTDPQVMFELAKELETRIREMTQPKQ